MGIDIKQMYLDLNELLEDICNFLSGDKLQNLSPKDQNLAESLINRSRIQLQEISKIQTNQNNEDYMIMDRKNDDSTRRVEAQVIEDDTIFPYADLPAKEASKDVKYGFILMKRRIMFLGFEKLKQVYGSIHEGWLLIYASDKDTKPLCYFNLRNYEAREFEGGKADFQLISSMAGRKSYHFVALTRKDVRQWVTQINKRHGHALNKDEMKEGRNEGFSDDDSDNIYERLVPMDPSRSSNHSIIPIPMPIPPTPSQPSKLSTINKSKPKKPIEVPPPVIKNFPKRYSSDFSDDECPPTTTTHKVVSETASRVSPSNSKRSSEAEGDSFSSDNDEEPIYEQYTTVQGQARCLRNNSAAICEAPTKSNLVNHQTISSSRFATHSASGNKIKNISALPLRLPTPPPSRSKSKSHQVLATTEDETDDSQSTSLSKSPRKMLVEHRESEDCIHKQFSTVGTVHKKGFFDSIGRTEGRKPAVPQSKYKPSICPKPPKLLTNQRRRGSIEPQ